MAASKIQSKQLCSNYGLFLYLGLLLGSSATAATTTTNAKPNIVIVLADDMGFNDVSFRGSNQFLTPNIDALAYSGVILNNFYAPAMCTPSRAALLTGKYPINTGLQHYVIVNDQPHALPLTEILMPSVLRDNGYYTSIIGKWHLGMSRKEYTPSQRGFDLHYGYLGAYIDYFDHTLYMENRSYARGHDFKENLSVQHTHTGVYVTDLLTDAAVELITTHDTKERPLFLILSHLAPHAANENEPLQAPLEEIEKFAYIKNKQRRIYAAMMSKLDQSVGEVVDALSSKQILNNTIIFFCSDNGGPTEGMHATTASNYPLRGQKNSPWEGGLRSSAAIWSTQLQNLGSVWQQHLYIADIFPTLMAAAGINASVPLPLDGLDLWKNLVNGYNPVDREIVHNIDDIFEYYSYSSGQWKLVFGSTENGTYDGWLGGNSANSSEVDPRSAHYADLIRSTTVWRQLSIFNSEHARINIDKLRSDVAVTCPFVNNPANITCQPLREHCLFRIDVDPCEQYNVYEQYKSSQLVLGMIERIEYFREHARTPENQPADPLCDPGRYNNEWIWWQDEPIKSENHSFAIKLEHSSATFMGSVAVLVLSHLY